MAEVAALVLARDEHPSATIRRCLDEYKESKARLEQLAESWPDNCPD
jgi:hypothetical protein